MDYNNELKKRIIRKIEALDKKNGGDYIATMKEIGQWAKKGTGELTKSVDYGDYIATTVCKDIVVNGVKGRGCVVIHFAKTGEVLEYLY